MKTFFKALLIILLVLILAVGGAAGYLYFTMKNMEVENISLEQLAQQEPMDSRERFTVDAGTGKIRIKINLYDAASLLRVSGVQDEDITGEIEKIARDIGIEPEAVGLGIEREGIRIDAAAFYNKIRLAGSLYCNARLGTDGTVTVIPEKVGVGFIKIPVSFIEKRAGFEFPKVELQMNAVDTYLIKGIDSIEPRDGCLEVSGIFNSDILEILSTQRNTDPIYRWYSDDYRYAIDAGKLYENGETQKAVETLLAPVQDGTVSMQQMMSDLLTVCSGSNTGGVIAEGGKLWSERLFPGLTAASVKDAHANLQQLCEHRETVMEMVADRIHELEKASRFTIKNGEILYSGKPLDLAEVLGSAAGDLDFLDVEKDVTLCLVEYPVADRRGLKALSKICDSEDSFSTRVYTDLVYPIAPVFRSRDGSHVIVYITYARSQSGLHTDILHHELAEHLWQEMDVEGKVAVADAKKS